MCACACFVVYSFSFYIIIYVCCTFLFEKTTDVLYNSLTFIYYHLYVLLHALLIIILMNFRTATIINYFVNSVAVYCNKADTIWHTTVEPLQCIVIKLIMSGISPFNITNSPNNIKDISPKPVCSDVPLKKNQQPYLFQRVFRTQHFLGDNKLPDCLHAQFSREQ